LLCDDRTMSALLYECCRLSFAILYPTYSSFKAVRGKNVREYVSNDCSLNSHSSNNNTNICMYKARFGW